MCVGGGVRVHVHIHSCACLLSEHFGAYSEKLVTASHELVFNRLFHKKGTYHRRFFETEISQISGIGVSPAVILLSLLYLGEVLFGGARLQKWCRNFCSVLSLLMLCPLYLERCFLMSL